MVDHGGDQRSVHAGEILIEWKLRKNTVIFYTFSLQLIYGTLYSLNPNKLLLSIVERSGKLGA